MLENILKLLQQYSDCLNKEFLVFQKKKHFFFIFCAQKIKNLTFSQDFSIQDIPLALTNKW